VNDPAQQLQVQPPRPVCGPAVQNQQREEHDRPGQVTQAQHLRGMQIMGEGFLRRVEQPEQDA